MSKLKKPPSGDAHPSTKVRLKALDYPVFNVQARKYTQWKKDFSDIILPRLADASEAEITLCLRNSISQTVLDKLASDCKTSASIFAGLDG